MKKVISEIYEETDYSVFKRLPDNREVLKDRLNKLMASISEKYVLCPISVNENMEIIDGQGRFEACKALGKPIHYYIAPGATSEDCKRMNKYNTKWGIKDFAVSYSKSGNMNYTYLLKACMSTGMPIKRTLRLANRAATDKTTPGGMSLFEAGRLTFTETDVAKVEHLVKAGREILEALTFDSVPNDAFWTSINVMHAFDNYDHGRMLEKCKDCRHTYHQMSKLRDELVEFERIYNFNTKLKKNRLFFSSYLDNKGYSVRDYDISKNTAAHIYAAKDVSTLKPIEQED